MTTYGRPGIYVKEAFSPLNPANGIPGESLPALCAVHPQGPSVPTLVSSWNQFVTLYGGFIGPESQYILPYAVSEFFTNGGQALYVLRVANEDAVAAELQLMDIASVPGNAILVNALSQGVWANNIFVEVVVNRPAHFNLNVYYPDTQHLVEQFTDVSMDPTDSRFAVNQVNSPVAGSAYIFLDNQAAPYVTGVTDLAPIGPTALASGSDGTPGNFDIASAAIAGFDLLQNQVLAINMPGIWDVATLNTVLTWCAHNQDKMLVIDGPPPDLYAISSPSYPGSVLTEYVDMVSAGNPTLLPTTYGAVYGPWLLLPDPSSSTPGSSLWMPPGPAVLAKYQQVDLAYGPWWAPAGVRAQLNGVIALETKFTNAQLDLLNQYHINAIKPVPSNGICVFGARTLDIGYQDMYVAVRREVMAIEHDLDNLLLFALFEPNGPRLWKQITSVANNYFLELFQKGAIGGTSQQTSYNVVCDESNNSVQSAMNGIVNVDIQLALLSSAEFIQLNLSTLTASSS
jgi:Bacteriophage tail sheath protein